LKRLLILPVVNLSMLTESLSRGEFVTTNLDDATMNWAFWPTLHNMSRNLKELYRNLEKRLMREPRI
jgi:nitrate/nitrite-specific signal transduction histidine kinase